VKRKIKCPDIRKRLSAFLDGEVTEPEKFYISEHLKTCGDCQNEAEKLSQISDFLSFFTAVDVSPYFVSRLKLRLAEEKAHFANWTKRLVLPLGIAALFLLALIDGGYLGRILSEPRTEKDALLTEEIANVSGVSAFEDFSEGSLVQTFTNLLAEGGD